MSRNLLVVRTVSWHILALKHVPKAEAEVEEVPRKMFGNLGATEDIIMGVPLKIPLPFETIGTE